MFYILNLLKSNLKKKTFLENMKLLVGILVFFFMVSFIFFTFNFPCIS